MAILSIDGSTPDDKEILEISKSWQEISLSSSFSIFGEILLGPTDLLKSSKEILLDISFLSVIFSQKGSRDLV